MTQLVNGGLESGLTKKELMDVGGWKLQEPAYADLGTVTFKVVGSRH